MASNFKTNDQDVGDADYRSFFDSQILRVWHLNGKKVVARIVRVTKFESEVYDQKTRERMTKLQPKLELTTRAGKPFPLPLLLNKVNAATIAGLYGKRTSGWVGKTITIYPARVEVGGKMTDGIRIENEPPPEKAAGKATNGAAAPAPAKAAPETEPARHVVDVVAPTIDADGVVHDGDPYTDGAEREPGDDTEDEPASEPPPGVLSTDRGPSSGAASLIT